MDKTKTIPKCPNCKSTKKLKAVRSAEEYEIAGHKFIVTVHALQCSECEEDLVQADELRRAELAVAERIARAGIVSGDAFRHMRGALGMKATELAELLQVTPESISRWENDKREVDRSAAMLLASMVLDTVEGKTTTRERLASALGAKKLPKTVDLGSVR